MVIKMITKKSYMIYKRYKQFIPYLTFLLIGFLFFPSAGRDDVHITYWAAYTLSNFGEIVNYNGDRVEQSSSLLHTLVLAGIHYISKANIVSIGSFLSIFFGLVTINLTGKLSLLINKEKFFSQIIIATSTPFIYWSFGALEASIVSTIILFILLTTIEFSTKTTIRNYILSLTAIILYLLVRPESFFVILLFLLITTVILFFQKERYIPFIILITTTVVLFLLLLTFRYIYFGAFFPQPVEAKIGMSIIEKVYSGIFYYKKVFNQYPFFILLTVPIIIYTTFKITKTIKNRNMFLLISLLISYLLFILFSGGDWMEGARFFVPIISLATIIAVSFYVPLLSRKYAIIGGVFFNVLSTLYFTIMFSTSYPIYNYNNYVIDISNSKEFSFFEIANRVHYRDIPFLFEFNSILKKMTDEGIRPTILSMQAGMVPYHIFQDYYKKAQFIDLFGLSTKDFTNCEVTSSLRRWKYGIAMNYNYFFSHLDALEEKCDIGAPDIIYDIGKETLNKVNFIKKQGYSLVYLQRGDIINKGVFKGGRVKGVEFIAIKTDIAIKLQLKIKEFKFR